MDWLNIVTIVLGALGGTGGIVSIYNARPNKNSIEIDNFKKLYDEAQEERQQEIKEHKEYKVEMESKVDKLEQRMDEMYSRLQKKLRAINSAYRCSLPKNIRDCPVLEALEKEDEEREIDCKI